VRWREGLFRLSGRRPASDTDRSFANAITDIESSDQFAWFVLNLSVRKRELDLDDVQNGAADSQHRIIKREMKYIVIWRMMQGDFEEGTEYLTSDDRTLNFGKLRIIDADRRAFCASYRDAIRD
jgi:hypothetical protein